MVGILIAIAAAIYFFVEAKKRGQNSFKWAGIAIITYGAPQVIISWLIVPTIFVMLQMPIEENLGIYSIISIGAFFLSFYLLVLARKKLYTYERIEPLKDKVVISSVEITENKDDTYSVSGKVFKTKQEAEGYVSVLNTLKY